MSNSLNSNDGFLYWEEEFDNLWQNVIKKQTKIKTSIFGQRFC